MSDVCACTQHTYVCALLSRRTWHYGWKARQEAACTGPVPLLLLSGESVYLPCRCRSVTTSHLTVLHSMLARLLCPWDSPDKNTRVGSHSLLQEIFLTQASNLRLLHWQADSLPLSHWGSAYVYHSGKIE